MNPTNTVEAGGNTNTYSDKKYKRTHGRKSISRLCWMPVIKDGIAYTKLGACYAVRKDGWRRLKVEKE